MKKRQHTRQIIYSYEINGSRSGRSLRSSTRSVSREMSDKLASSAKNAHNVAKEEINPMSQWLQEEETVLKLANEINENELKQFSFTCIEVLATLSDGEKPYLLEALIGAVEAKLPTYVKLSSESQQAKVDFKEQRENTKQFMSELSAPASDAKVLECVQQTMCQKYRSESLTQRVAFLQTAVPDYMAKVGLQIGLPKALMQKVSKALTVALIKCAK